MKRLRGHALIAGVTFLCVTSPLAACGPWDIRIHFWLPYQPGQEREQFLQGQLGILDSQLDPAYQYVAYRYLTGLEDGSKASDNLKAFASLWPTPQTEPAVDPVSAWREARAQVPGVQPIGWFSRTRQVRTENGDNSFFSYILNCLDDALWTATETLQARIDRFGLESREVRAWVSAQDDVFSNCGDGESIPVPLDSSWDPLLRDDREYQIAAAYFYADRYPDAADRFRTIARDDDSPWRELSAYLVARALIRNQELADAGQQLRSVLETPDFASMHEPAQRLLGYTDLRTTPWQRRQELNERLLAPQLTAPVRQDFIDYLWLLERGHVAAGKDSSPADELGTWLAVMAKRAIGSESSWDLPLQKWQQEREPAWLVAALTAAEPNLDVNGPLLQAAETLAASTDKTSPAHLTVAYHRARLLIGLGHDDEARAVLDPILEQPDELAPADLNRFRVLRAEVTPELDEYLRLTALVPAGLGWDDGSRSLMSATDFPYYQTGDPLLTNDAVELINHGLSLEEMLALAEGDLLPSPWRRRLALAVWTRAVVIGWDDVALAAASLVGSLEPELTSEMERFTAASAANRRFEAVWTLLRFSGLSPVLRWNVGRQTPIGEIDELRDNGWCQDVLQAEITFPQQVRTPEQLAAVQADLPTNTPAWPDFVGLSVIAHAENHPDDPRVPEALHRVVRATRVGCPEGSYGEISRAAFQRLHQNFPTNPWTKQTPYWFN